MRLNDSEVNTFLFGIMDSLEMTKRTLVINNDSGAITCENYAYNVFAKADDEYRAGESTKETARNFYAASSFFDILEQFGPLDEEIIEKRKYSKWKAADILKAIQSGQRPTLPDTPPVRKFYCMIEINDEKRVIFTDVQIWRIGKEANHHLNLSFTRKYPKCIAN